MPEKKSFFSLWWPGLALLFISVLITFCSYKDYGVAWDEPEQRYMGEVSYNYMFHGDTTLNHFPDRDHGVGFELVLTAIEHKFKITDSRSIYLMRHLVTHLFFLLSVLCGYVLIYRLFKNRLLSCLGFILLAFHPRIYAHSFFNTKDIPFLGMFLICLLLSGIAFDKNKWWWYATLGLACGYATSIRILGVLLVPLLGMFLLIDIISTIRAKGKVIAAAGNLFIFLACSCISLYTMWPVLWGAPAQNFIANFSSLSHFPWNGEVLFNGNMVHAKDLPWYYLPVWICISTPVLWVLSGTIGILLIIFAFVNHPASYLLNTPKRNYLLYLLCFALPLLSIIALHSIVYDDWRHVYFIYPSFVILGLYAISRLPAGKGKIIVGVLCVLQVADTGVFMVRNHPFQQVYFNRLVSHKDEALRYNYDLDYWGVAYQQGLEHILAHDTSSQIRIHWNNRPVKTNYRLLPEQDRKRIDLVDDTARADYFITNFRGHQFDYKYPSVYYEVKVLNSTIMRVYKPH